MQDRSDGSRGDDLLRWYVPGRIEVLGKHTDYAGGRSLLCALERGLTVTARPRADQMVRVTDVIRRVSADIPLSAREATPPTDWRVYPWTVVTRTARNFPGPLRGVDISFASDLPTAAGLSSSSALIVAIFTALADLNDLERHPVWQASLKQPQDLAAYLGCVENGHSFGSLEGDAGVGTRGGSQDHTAILMSRANTISQFRFAPVVLERTAPMPAGFVFVIGVSGVAASKTGTARTAYNRAAFGIAGILDGWRRATGRADDTLHDALASAADAAERLRAMLKHSPPEGLNAQEALDRLAQFIEESFEIVPAAGDALIGKNLTEFGTLVDRSQHAAERWLRNQVPETIALARSARRLGAVAASAFGAGFGGSVWSMVGAADADEFRSAWARDYELQFPEHAGSSTFFVTGAGPGLARSEARRSLGEGR